MNSRAEAAKILKKIFEKKTLLGKIPDHADKAFIQAVCFGVMRFYPRLNAIIKKLLHKQLPKGSEDVYALLLIGLYQLEYMRVPDHAAVGETVAAARQLKRPWATGLLNANLRRFQREREAIFASLKNEPSYHYNHPQWFVKKVKKAWPHEWEKILSANDEHPPFTLRINLSKINREAYQKLLAEEGITSIPTPFSSAGLKLASACAIEKLKYFDEGWCSIQDESAQLAGEILELPFHARVLDACAAPGGKAMHLIEKNPNIDLLMLEEEPERVKQIEENFKRLSLKPNIVCVDASKIDLWWDKRNFDAILLDAPCSATGVIRRHPDIKYLRQEQDITTITKVQQSLLKALWKTLKPQGYLLYVTCSILPEENDEAISMLLEEEPSANVIPIEAAWGVKTNYGRQALPDSERDGFYYALLQK